MASTPWDSTPKQDRSSTAPSTPMFTKASADTKMRSVMMSVNTVISKSENLRNITQSAAKSTNQVVEAYVPMVLEYLPEKKVGPELLVMLSMVLLVCILVSLGATHLLIDTASVIYPCYASIVALESPQPEDDKQWLTYWLIFTFMKLTDRVTRPVLSFLPFFPVFKILGFGWLYHPDFLGAKLVYGLLQPSFKKVIVFFEPSFNMTPAQLVEWEEKKRTADALNRVYSEVDSDRKKEDKAPSSDISDDINNSVDKENTPNSPKNNNNNNKNSPKKKSSAAASVAPQTKAPQEAQEEGAQLQVVLKQVCSLKEVNIYCEAKVVPPTGSSHREKKGIEGVSYKTDKVLGTNCVYGKSMSFCPLTHLDGQLVVDVLEKPTFKDAVVLGRVSMSLLDVSQGAAASTSTLTAKYIDGAKKGQDVEGLTLTLSVQLLVG